MLNCNRVPASTSAVCITTASLRAQGAPGLGENIYQVSGPAGSLPPMGQVLADAVTLWYAEIQDYNYASPGARAACGVNHASVLLRIVRCNHTALRCAHTGIPPLNNCPVSPNRPCSVMVIMATRRPGGHRMNRAFGPFTSLYAAHGALTLA